MGVVPEEEKLSSCGGEVPKAGVSAALTLAALAVAAGSAARAWATFSYWEAGPILGTVAATAVLACADENAIQELLETQG